MTLIPKNFVPTFLKSSLSGSRAIQLTYSDISDTNISSTSSFIYDPSGTPLKSTQQLEVDWSKFENHTFFMSAEAKVNLAFDTIINHYPFDGTRQEVEKFFENLSGFENYVFEQFPKYRGSLIFSGTQPNENGANGTWIKVKDFAGSLFPELAKNPSGESILSPDGNTSITIETQIFVPPVINSGVSTIFQKISGSNYGFCLYLMPTASISTVEARFSVFSGSNNLTTTTNLNKGQYNHIALTLNKDTSIDYVQFFKNLEVVDISRSNLKFGDLNLAGTDFLIGSGSAFSVGSTIITPTQTFSGSIDEFRFFHSVRSVEQLKQYAHRSIFSTEDLKLYYRFNEPPPVLTTGLDNIVIDSSGNSLHSTINAFTGSLRLDINSDPNSVMSDERELTAPILFPFHSGVINFNTDLLSSASIYDQANPNLITKLIPQHYLLEGADFEGLIDPDDGVGNAYSGTGIAGQGKMSNVQLMLSFLFIYARFFDDLKLYVDHFRNINFVDYNSEDTVPDNFLLKMVENLGFNLPPLFNDSTIEQYVRAENIDPEVSISELSLRSVQNQILRRVLKNMPTILASKGTQHSIKAFLRSVGIDPDNSLRIREYGGATSRNLSFSREEKREPNFMASFITSSLAISPYLSSSRIESGYPNISGSFVKQNLFPPNGISNNRNDGLFTSGSWTVEGIYKWNPVDVRRMTSGNQSLVRICTTGSNGMGLISNLVAVSGSTDDTCKLLLYVRAGNSATNSPYLTLPLSASGLFNGQKWNISFGRTRSDSRNISDLNSSVSSSYFLRAGRQEVGEIEQFYATSSYFYEIHDATELNIFQNIHTASNASGSFLCLGENQTITATTSSLFLNNSSSSVGIPSDARTVNFTGHVSNFRFWSKDLSENEWKEHIRNYKSTGVQEPATNWNFTTTPSGSFERLRLDSITKQETKIANSSGLLNFLDFSLNNNHLTGTGFPIDNDTLAGELFEYSYLSPNFDEASTTEKIRVRGFLNQDLVDARPYRGVAPYYEIPKSEEPTDDVRFSIDFNLIDALNRDIVNIFSTFDKLDNAIGAPELMFSPDYPDLDRLRNIYFNRIQSKLNFQSFFEFFRWFDTSIGTFIEQLIPRKTNFKGVNFLVESHMLERHKIEYFGNEMYLGAQNRARFDSNLLLEQISGVVRKY